MTQKSTNWYSNGKLLITGEYLVMDGAQAFALPLKFGQSIEVLTQNKNILSWQAIDPSGIWLEVKLRLPDFEIVSSSSYELAKKLVHILKEASKLSKIEPDSGWDIVTKVDFNRDFGFGTSSTLISNIAYWLDIDPYELLDKTFGGSGYDIACARSDSPIIYQKSPGSINIEPVVFNPPFKENIYFVYLGKKQSSSEGIAAYRDKNQVSSSHIQAISDITIQVINTESLSDFERLITEHEDLMSGILNLPKVKSKYFSGFTGAAKSLGAWGGDMVLLTNSESDIYFREKLISQGFEKIFRFDEIVK